MSRTSIRKIGSNIKDPAVYLIVHMGYTFCIPVCTEHITFGFAAN